MHVDLVGPERVLYTGEASMVVARTLDGEIGLLTGHGPLLGALLPGLLRIVKEDGTDEVAAVLSGFVEVCGGRVVVLTDVAELAGEIDVERAWRAKEGAEERLRTTEDDEKARAALQRALVRLDVAGGGAPSKVPAASTT